MPVCAPLFRSAVRLAIAASLVAAAGLPHAIAQTSVPAPSAGPRPQVEGYQLGPGDQLRISVYQSPDLSIEARLNDASTINFPLLGTIQLGGLTIPQAETRLADALRTAGLVRNPQVMMLLTQARSNQVSVLGAFARPGRYPLDVAGMRLTEALALAGGVVEAGSDTLVIVRPATQSRPATRMEIHLPSLFAAGGSPEDPILQSGDVLWVDRAPQIYIQGEVPRGGPLRLLRNMTLRQALATAGGITSRGTLKGLELHRRDAQGQVRTLTPSLDDIPQDGDVIVVRESLF